MQQGRRKIVFCPKFLICLKKLFFFSFQLALIDWKLTLTNTILFAFVRSPEQSGSSYQPASRQNFQWNWHKHLCFGRSWEHLLVPSIHTAKICPWIKNKSKATILASKVIFVWRIFTSRQTTSLNGSFPRFSPFFITKRGIFC